MRRSTFSSGLALAFLALAAAPVAAAQAGLRGKQVGGTVPTSTQSSTTAVLPQPATEPKDVEGMLAAQNEARRKLNLAPLSWSAELTEKAKATAAIAVANSCSKGGTQRAGDGAGAAVYWAAALPRYSGAYSVQSISPSFLVSEWQIGRSDYDNASGECRRSGECLSWARMVAPAARAVGCAKVICPSQGQVWVCQYDTPAPKPAPAELRRRNAN